MIEAHQFLDEAHAHGFDFYTGVPCSFLTEIINHVISDDAFGYVGAASEGEAVAIAAGAWLAGAKPVVMCQNSGLGNAVNPLTSLNWPFRIPVLMIVTWRGGPGISDEPQHELMGEITPDLLDTIKVPHAAFPTRQADVAKALDKAGRVMRESELPFAFIMEKDSIAPGNLTQAPIRVRPTGPKRDMLRGGVLPGRIDILRTFLETVDEETAVIATTGKTGRELFTLADRRQHLYQVGSMGGASAMGLGLALRTPRHVAVLDGDGAALMKMGNMATIGAYAPDNLIHIVLDNGVHDSTGGQGTVSRGVDFAAVALASGYRGAVTCDSPDGFADAYLWARHRDGPTLIRSMIAPGSMKGLGRPTVTPYEVARRFSAFIAG